MDFIGGTSTQPCDQELLLTCHYVQPVYTLFREGVVFWAPYRQLLRKLLMPQQLGESTGPDNHPLLGRQLVDQPRHLRRRRLNRLIVCRSRQTLNHALVTDVGI